MLDFIEYGDIEYNLNILTELIKVIRFKLILNIYVTKVIKINDITYLNY